jgi:hypothetical protein
MAVAFLRIILYFGLLLLVMSLFALAVVPRAAPGFVAAVLAVIANVVTVGGAAILLRVLLAREAQREKEADECWKAFGEHVNKQDDRSS